jgi:RHS repeat-associated protein
LSDIKYNNLNLPYTITKVSDKIGYVYDVTGRKLANKLSGKTKYYFGNFVYTDDKLEYMICSEGLLNINGSTTNYEFHLKDHLGNTRVAVNETNDITQENNYYPFGLTFAQSGSSTNKYLYNGKEKQEETEWLDYGARMYTPELGRWFNVDPLSESYYNLSPYGYVAGNPIACRDENGEWINFVIGAVVGAVVDAGLQAVEIALDDNKTASDFSWKSVGGSALTGAVGLGIVSKVDKALKVVKIAKTVKVAAKVGTELIVDASASATNQLITKGEVNLKDVAIDATAGQLIGGPLGRKTKVAAQKSQASKTLKTKANRANRVASSNNSRSTRKVAADKATEKANDYGSRRAAATSVAGANAASNTVKKITDEKKK